MHQYIALIAQLLTCNLFKKWSEKRGNVGEMDIVQSVKDRILEKFYSCLQASQKLAIEAKRKGQILEIKIS